MEETQADQDSGGARPISSWALELLACISCHSELIWSSDEARCTSCAYSYPVVDGIPVFLRESSGDSHQHEEASSQASYYDHLSVDEFEITRPRGTPEIYEWLLREKFRRALGGIQQSLGRATAVVVCGGSGMDAEFLVETGLRVISSDISLGAARRCRERSQRFGLGVVSIVADAQQLPFRNRSIGLVYVHDGLHHLATPERAVAEMARVSARWVSVSEPARATATQVAIRLRLAREYEEAGNRVARLRPADVSRVLTASGFRVIRAERYAMYYPHSPGRIIRLLSTTGIAPLVLRGWQLANALVGARLGNKLVVQAERPSIIQQITAPRD